MPRRDVPRSETQAFQILEFLFENRDRKFSQAEVIREKDIGEVRSVKGSVSEWFQAFREIGIVKEVNGKYAWYSYQEVDKIIDEVLSESFLVGVPEIKESEIKDLVGEVISNLEDSEQWSKEEKMNLIEAKIRSRLRKQQKKNL